VSNIVTLPITADGSPCPDPLEYTGLALAGKSQINVGTLILERLFDRGSSGSTNTFDFAHFFFVQYRQPFYNLFKGATADPGTCFVQQFNNRVGPLTQEVALNAGAQMTLTIG